jgi:hypothetical protein
MRQLSHLALALCVTFATGSVAEAGRRAGHHAKSHKKEKAADAEDGESIDRHTRSRASSKPRLAQKTKKRARPVRPSDEAARDDDDDMQDDREDARDKKRDRKRSERRDRDDDDDSAIDGDDTTDDDSDDDDDRVAFAERDDDDDDDDGDDDDDDDDRVAFAETDDDDVVEGDDNLDEDAELVDVAPARKRGTFRDWKIAIGPDLWMASVDADVSLGSASVSQGVDFMDITRHTSFGAAAVADARYGRFTLGGDLLYGVIDLAGAKDVGPLMVSLDGTATSLLVNGLAGYRVYGKDDSVLWLEARGGMRYQRTAVTAAVNVSGNPVTPPAQIDAGADAIGGARVTVRPAWMGQRFSFSAAFDTRVFGSSNNTWSAQAEATARVGDYVLVSLGYKTLLQDRAPVSTTMHGPRLAVLLAF